MPADRTLPFGERLESATDRYLDRLEDCVATLPTLVEEYTMGAEYQPTVERIQHLESDCDGIKLELGKLVTTADGKDVGIRMTWVHLHADRMLELYGHLDTIANASEQFAEELVAMSPRQQNDCLDGLTRMSELAAAAMLELEYVVREFVRTLCRPEYSTSITGGVSAIRALEGEADAVRNQVLEAAFDRDSDAHAVAYRQLAVLLDGVLDAMEDVTDQMHLMTSPDTWFDIEIYPEYSY
ncbi:MAG: DUF47 domain-containing protein [Halobacteriota archaeon]|uniref:DUF47 domain-containing protein n=1 Tax=Natronomonas sp. TaxID=2184060 RepID=UPI003976DE38